MECFWLCLPLSILRLGASCELACLAPAGVWMNMAGNKTNDFYAQLEPYVNSGEGAVSRISHNELFPILLLLPDDLRPYPGEQDSITLPNSVPGHTFRETQLYVLVPLVRPPRLPWYRLCSPYPKRSLLHLILKEVCCM